ncbi:MAG TPA: EamA family transporter RarD [Kofleriaceae bacterium]|nr:EamA family transporter RarD [Kofleriaceae bacterium]
MTRSSYRVGLLQGVLAYGLWGIVAAYWKLLSHVSPVELIAHRAVWGLGSFLIIVVVAGQWRPFVTALRDLRLVGVMALSSFLLAINWGVFVGATTHGHLLDASLGYFINPLVSIALGTLVLRERLRRLQWIAIALAAIGVGVLTWRAGRIPWIALVLAGTWGLYGLVRKTARVDALVGSTIETVLLAPIAAVYLIAIGGGVMPTATASTNALLVGTGVITVVPLVLFTSAARRLPLSTVGFLQYLAPTGQFLLAVLAFGEPLAHDRLMAFAWIWAGLAAFSIDRARQAAAASASQKST